MVFLFLSQFFSWDNTSRPSTQTKQFDCPWFIGGDAKLWEWAANPEGAILTLLLRKSDEGGGGDFYGYHKGCGEGGPIHCDLSPVAGRWAGDRVMMLGDYNSSELWKELPRYHNISEQLVQEWNEFICWEDRKLRFNAECSCGEQA